MKEIKDIRRGEEVFCHGEWIKSPAPVEGTVLKCTFATLPTTCFEPQFAGTDASICHRMVLSHEGKLHPGLTVRGYLQEQKEKRDCTFVCNNVAMLPYWYPKVIDFFNIVRPPVITATGFFRIYASNDIWPALEELHGDELSEENLELFLEGLLRKRFTWLNDRYGIGSVTNETARLVLRLLDISIIIGKNGNTEVITPANLLRHVKDDMSKSMVTDEQVAYSLMKSIELPVYTSCNKVLSTEEVQGWYLPGINPDVNGISPLSMGDGTLRNKCVVKVDSKGRKTSYDSGNLYEQFLLCKNVGGSL